MPLARLADYIFNRSAHTQARVAYAASQSTIFPVAPFAINE